jgi:ABC-type transporter Mla maintaining outer membrane lipid asymmetry ATPase subunit MlaF
MPEMLKSLKFEKVTIGFDGSEILQACDFNFPMKQNCRLVFANDREKFFFFHALSQLSGFNKGQFLINDENVLDFSFEEFGKYRLQIGFGFSTRGLIHNLTLRANLELPIRYHQLLPENEIRSWIENCAEYFKISDDLDRRPSDVPTNSQKATLILRAFVHKPEMIILDNPDLLLSNRYQANLLQLIEDHRKLFNLKHLFFSTNDESFSDCLTDQNIILTKKRLNLVNDNYGENVS